MTLKEFLERNPTAVEEAAKCTTLEEFKTLAEGKGLVLGSPEAWNEAFAFVKSQSEGEIGDDALGSVSGGVARQYDKDDIYTNKSGNVVAIGKGKKI